jgi:hypothetical protein
MRKTIKPQNETLDAVVTAQAKRQAQRLGVELSTYVGRLAAKADSLPVTINVRLDDIQRINARIGGGRVHDWVAEVVVGALDGADEVLNGNRITLDLEPEMAADLREAAEFEEMSVEEYLLDGLKRDLDLSQDLMAAEGGAR